MSEAPEFKHNDEECLPDYAVKARAEVDEQARLRGLKPFTKLEEWDESGFRLSDEEAEDIVAFVRALRKEGRNPGE